MNNQLANELSLIHTKLEILNDRTHLIENTIKKNQESDLEKFNKSSDKCIHPYPWTDEDQHKLNQIFNPNMHTNGDDFYYIQPTTIKKLLKKDKYSLIYDDRNIIIKINDVRIYLTQVQNYLYNDEHKIVIDNKLYFDYAFNSCQLASVITKDYLNNLK